MHRGARFRCRDIWYTSDDNVNCGFARDNKGERIFDSQVKVMCC